MSWSECVEKKKNSMLIQALWGLFPRGGALLKEWGLGSLRYLPTHSSALQAEMKKLYQWKAKMPNALSGQVAHW